MNNEQGQSGLTQDAFGDAPQDPTFQSPASMGRQRQQLAGGMLDGGALFGVLDYFLSNVCAGLDAARDLDALSGCLWFQACGDFLKVRLSLLIETRLQVNVVEFFEGFLINSE